MTVHAAKGLEFNAVFVSGLEEGLFPHENSLYERGGLEEERRLMYVAITRARERLYLSFAQSRMLHGQVRYHLRSRFFDELPEGLLKWLSVNSAAARAEGRRSGADGGSMASAGAGNAARSSARSPAAGGNSLPAGFRIGQNVRHARFGSGVVLAAEGSGNDAKIQINFADVGKKWLLLSVAKLEPL